MTKEQIEAEMAELKSDYVRIQGDVEKATSFGVNTSTGEKKMIEIEERMKELNQKLEAFERY
ncbi:SE1832 family protein [Lentibacillus sp.]|uniref:SE1832 family protein n=1 Tax=Lentibacillus sp. TaxID=1925746 RepID=UPI002B4AAF3C|nr:SE1832 family protein [Lentibacillus sp.]HLS08645.1 SE1832 family protein [Lentibacillus sp.]